jgi:protein-disulfide isomerase
MTNETKILTGIGIVTAIIIIIAAFTLGGKPAQTEQPKTLGQEQSKTLVLKDSYSQGPANAKVTITEFGDFQCPACGVAYPTVERIKKEYNGKIRFVFRQFPLQAHKNAHTAALAAEAAGAQHKFWEMYNKLYENQKEWSDSDKPLDIFSKYAQEFGLNIDQFKKDVEDKKYDNRIKKDQDDALALGVNATPTFFINNEMEVGILPYDDFKQKIDAALK